jgi:hypothetical protein
MNFRDRRRYWLQAARQMRRHELAYAPKIQQVIKRAVDKMVREAETVGFQRAFANMDLFDEELTALLMDIYRKVGLAFAIQTNRLLAKEERKDIFFNADVIQRIVNILGVQALNLVTRMSETTKQEILKIIQEGEENQSSYREIALAIEQSFVLGYPRSLTIARTEVARAANIGAMQAAEKQNFFVEKVWVAGNDRLTRRFSKEDNYDHWQMDGQRRDLDQPFEQTGMNGVTAVAMQPGDPAAPASYTINCRCVVVFEGKRDERGRLVRKRPT